MQTTIKQVSPVEYELELNATAADLEPEFKKALRAQQSRTQLKGFRPGKVPPALVKKMYGRALAYELAEKTVQETYEKEVLNADEHNVLGQPRLTVLDYDMDGDLHAVIRFGVRPEVEFKDLSGETLPRLAHQVEDEEVDRTLERLRREHADLVPVEEGGAGDEDQVVIDMQQVDEATGTPIIGKREEDVTLFLDDDRVHDELREGLKGRQAGDTFRVELPHGHGDHVHTHRYEVSVKEVKRRDLPELDDEFARELSNGRLDSVEALRKEITEQLQEEWDKQSRETLEGMMIARMLELHPVPVPESAVETFQEYFIEDVKRRNKGELPAGFDAEAFRRANREEAERQARWMILRDALIEQEGLEVTEEDLDAFFEKTSRDSPELSPQLLRQYYQSMGMVDRVRERQLSDQVFAALRAKFNIVDKDKETFEADLKARSDQETPAAISAPAEPSSAEEEAQ